MLIKNDNEIVFLSLSLQSLPDQMNLWINELKLVDSVAIFFIVPTLGVYLCANIKPKNGFYAVNIAKHVFHISHTWLQF